MPQRGEIVVERLTGNRAMVIEVVSPEEITCRFADGRLEDRFTFEVEPLLSLRDPRGGGRFVLLGSLVWLFLSGFVNRWFQQGAPGRLAMLTVGTPARRKQRYQMSPEGGPSWR